jgi:Holliday junction resolvase RusA-like endonuclease
METFHFKGEKIMIEFIIPGEPKSKARHRTTKSGVTYTPKDTVNFENWVKQCFIIEHKGKFLEGQIKATIKAYFSIPKSYSKKKRASIEEGTLRPTKKPDTDNLAKSILDSLNGIAYKDDSAIVTLQVDKYFANEPRVEVILEVIGELI